MHRDECDNNYSSRCGVDAAGRRRIAGHCHEDRDDLVRCGATANWGASSARWHTVRTGGRAQDSCAVRSCAKCLVECKGAHAFDLDEIEFPSETPPDNNPLGIKAGGEAGTVPALAVMGNAVLDALSGLGVDHVDMPFTAANIWAAIDGAPNTAE